MHPNRTVLLVAAALAAGTAPALAAGTTTTLVSASSRGAPGSRFSQAPSLSADGHLVAFDSFARNLVPGGVKGQSEVYVRDRSAGTTERISVAPGGGPANGGSGSDISGEAISGDGRLVVFSSGASNLVAGDTNGAADVFVRDRKLGVTTLVSVGTHGRPGNGDSGQSGGPSISTDGRFVTFFSVATNLVPGGSSGVGDIFVRDLQAGTTELVSVGAGGAPANDHSGTPSISADGRFVTFASFATNLAPGPYPRFSENLFLRDRKLGTTEVVSVGPTGRPGNGFSDFSSISASGRFVAFSSDATNLVRGVTAFDTEVFVRDRKLGTTALVSVMPNGKPADLSSDFPVISANGRLVAFESESALVAGDTNDDKDVFVRDLVAGTTARVSVGPKGRQGNGQSGDDGLAISPDGLTVAFTSTATDLVPGVTGGVEQIYARAR